MSVDVTHYVVIGVVCRNYAIISDILNDAPEKEAILDEYSDDAHKEKVSKNKHGIHVIADGMNGDYIIVGQIIDKSVYDGLKVTQISLATGKATDRIKEKIEELDRKIGTSFGKLEISAICFTHFH